MKGGRKDARRLADFVFKMAECSMADDYAIFKKEHGPVCFTNFEGKVFFFSSSVPGGSCFPTIERATASLQDSPMISMPFPGFPCRRIIEETASDLLERKKAVRQ